MVLEWCSVRWGGTVSPSAHPKGQGPEPRMFVLFEQKRADLLVWKKYATCIFVCGKITKSCLSVEKVCSLYLCLWKITKLHLCWGLIRIQLWFVSMSNVGGQPRWLAQQVAWWSFAQHHPATWCRWCRKNQRPLQMLEADPCYGVCAALIWACNRASYFGAVRFSPHSTRERWRASAVGFLAVRWTRYLSFFSPGCFLDRLYFRSM